MVFRKGTFEETSVAPPEPIRELAGSLTTGRGRNGATAHPEGTQIKRTKPVSPSLRHSSGITYIMLKTHTLARLDLKLPRNPLGNSLGSSRQTAAAPKPCGPRSRVPEPTSSGPPHRIVSKHFGHTANSGIRKVPSQGGGLGSLPEPRRELPGCPRVGRGSNGALRPAQWGAPDRLEVSFR